MRPLLRQRHVNDYDSGGIQVLNGSEYATRLTLRSSQARHHAACFLRMHADDDDDDDDGAVDVGDGDDDAADDDSYVDGGDEGDSGSMVAWVGRSPMFVLDDI
jgi:hypothetical protein